METIVVSQAPINDQIALCKKNIGRIKEAQVEAARFVSQLKGSVGDILDDPAAQLQKALKEQLMHCLRVLQALEAEYPEITLPSTKPSPNGTPAKLALGFLREDDPRFFKWPGLWILGAGILTWGVASTLLTLFSPPESSSLRNAIGLGFTIGILGAAMMAFISWAHNDGKLQQKELPSHWNVLFLRRKLPPSVLAKCKVAQQSGLFDPHLRVLAPWQAFYRVRAADPVVVGMIGERSFLVAQFDLGKDRQG